MTAVESLTAFKGLTHLTSGITMALRRPVDYSA